MVDAGQIQPIVPCGCPVGTTIEVRDLFCNLPVRRKFLRQAATEFGHVSEQFTRIALANPRVHLVLRHNDRTVYELPGTDRLLERIELFFGGELTGQLIAVEADFKGSRLWGYVGHPSESRSTRKGQYLFLNGRWIQDRSLQHALSEAYRGLLMVGRNPITFLFLETPADSVDVNVHPTKAEVRFRDSQTLYRLILSTIRNRFLGMDLNSSLDVAGKGGGLKLEPLKPKTADPEQQQAAQQELVDWVKQQATLWSAPGSQPPAGETVPSELTPGSSAEWNSPATNPDFGWNTGNEASPPQPAATGAQPARPSNDPFGTSEWNPPRNDSTVGDWRDPMREESQSADTGHTVDEPNSAGSSPSLPAATAPFAEGIATEHSTEPVSTAESPQVPPRSEALDAAAEAVRRSPPMLPDNVRAMQIHDSYLVVESDEGLTVVDQHALHERILYEHLRKRVLSGGVESQRLLVPLPVEMPPAQVAALLEHLDLLASFGLRLQDFGGNTLLVTSYPVMLRRLDPAALLKDLSEQILETGRDPSRRDMLDSLLHMMSCKGAVKAGQRLTADEIDSLLAQRHLIDDAHHCPHGRPTALVLSRAELDRQFGRLG
ncbi:MAG: DNA mismatch repair endonuclease MutL [Planctomycetota bacterium]|nr:DNA mismatch repair endonuclease MutL [Planctomycetota bacterium]